MTESVPGRLGYLDGLRGLAAFWVISGHACILTGFYIPLVSSPNFAVDLFMLISGFLMYYQATLRSDREPFEAPSTWAYFWIRRFFRLSPVYYLALFFAIAFGLQLNEWRDAIASALPQTATPTARYTDQSWQNIVAHLTYFFGFSPTYSYRTALPDWSIGLEMQFYLFFPALFALGNRVGPIVAALAALGVSIGILLLFPAFTSSFEMPTLLPLKINLFLAGMMMAACLYSPRPWLYFAFGVALALLSLDGHHSYKGALIRMFCAIGVGSLAFYHKVSLPRFVFRGLDLTSRILSHRFFFWLGELSYSAYLIHLLIMLPVAAVLNHAGFTQSWLRFSLCLVIVSSITYAVSWIILRIVEEPGRALGRELIRHIKRLTERTPSVAT
ncbi:acyltransferase [Bradyrhizobium sp. JYMT SZCCT0428]|uniref:acyltransferase family protein n=1 Tax=Bradyrhizobium sp. JYMT SZCCT0428 TaxID=2807673 RepID=UPI001BAD9FCD|nr:acyltransferase [Bradyrhizobium sp. JYMT SZCCT0428]MBR1151588.1 acyltransferase [Bradyrhizobium sp. JYMT SZCCT0428]